MKVGDMVVIGYCPFDAPNLFGYQNGDIGIILELINTDLADLGSSTAKLYLLNGLEILVPLQYIKKMEA